MAFGKRQLVLAALVVALGAAVYLNWQFSDNRDLLATNTVTSSQKELGEAQYVNNSVSGGDVSSGSDSSDTSSMRRVFRRIIQRQRIFRQCPADSGKVQG